MAGSTPGDSPTQEPLSPPIPHEQIQIEIDGHCLIGQIVNRTQRDIFIRILFPYINISSGLHIPYFGCSDEAFTGDLGNRTARKLLERCYNLGQYLEQNFNMLQRAWIAYRSVMEASPVPEHYGREAFLARRRTLKDSLKKGALTPQQYQLNLSQLKKATERFDYAQHRLICTFLESNIPQSLNMGDQVIPLLEGRLDYISSSIPSPELGSK